MVDIRGADYRLSGCPKNGVQLTWAPPCRLQADKEFLDFALAELIGGAPEVPRQAADAVEVAGSDIGTQPLLPQISVHLVAQMPHMTPQSTANDCS